MCQLNDVNQPIGCLNGKLILGNCSISTILFGALIAYLTYDKSFVIGFYNIAVGLLMIIAIFFPYTWMIYCSLVLQISCALMTGFFAYYVLELLLGIRSLKAFTSDGFWIAIVLNIVSVFLTILSILSIMVYVKALKTGEENNDSSDFSSSGSGYTSSASNYSSSAISTSTSQV